MGAAAEDETREMYEGLADGIREFRSRLAELRVTADSADGLVSATVGGRGELIGLTIDPRVYRAPDSRGLADTITGTVRHAAERARREAFELARPFLRVGAGYEETDVDFDPALHQLDRVSRRT